MTITPNSSLAALPAPASTNTEKTRRNATTGDASHFEIESGESEPFGVGRRRPWMP